MIVGAFGPSDLSRMQISIFLHNNKKSEEVYTRILWYVRGHWLHLVQLSTSDK